jgi:hypothetical protein
MLSGNFTDPLASIAQGNGLAFNAVRPNAPNTFSCLERVHMGLVSILYESDLLVTI